MFSPFDLDCILWRKGRRGRDSLPGGRFVPTRFGKIRFYDSGGEKPALVMVPDGPCFLEHFSRLITLAERDWRVLLFDMPGFGWSLPEGGYRHSFGEASEVINAVMDSAAVKKATFAFSCANGYYGIHFAKHHAERMERLVLIQTPGVKAMGPWKKRSIPWPLQVPYLGQLAVFWKRLAIPGIWFRTALPKASPNYESYTRVSCQEITRGGCNCLASLVQGMNAMEERSLLGAEVAVHLIWGAKDHSHKGTDPLSIREIVPHATVEVWEDVGHFANLEAPERFLQACAVGL